MKKRPISEDGYLRIMEQKLQSKRIAIAWLLAIPWLFLMILIVPAAYGLFTLDLNPDNWQQLDAFFIRIEEREPVEFMSVREKTYLVTTEGDYYAYRLQDELVQSGISQLKPGTPVQLMLYDGGWRMHDNRMLLAGVASGECVYVSTDHILRWQQFDLWFSGGALGACLIAGILINVFTLKHTAGTLTAIKQKIARRNERISRRHTPNT